MEAGRVELPSEEGIQAVSTCVDRWQFSLLLCQRTIAEAASPIYLIPTPQAMAGTSPLNDADTREREHLPGQRVYAIYA